MLVFRRRAFLTRSSWSLPCVPQINSSFIVQGKKNIDYGNPGARGCLFIYAGISTGPCRAGGTPANLAASVPALRKRMYSPPKCTLHLVVVLVLVRHVVIIFDLK